VENGGLVKVLDLDQVPLAFEKGLITNGQAMSALKISAWILDVIYRGDLHELLEHFNVHMR